MKNQFLRLTVIFILYSVSGQLWGQEGGPFLTNYPVADESMADNFSLCQDKDGVLIVANRKGLLVFDADEWKVVKTPDLPLVVAFDAVSEKVFVGCREHAGYISRNRIGDYEFIDLKIPHKGLVSQVLFAEGEAFLLSESALSVIDTKNPEYTHSIDAPAQSAFSFGMSLRNQIIIDVTGKGLMLLNEGSLEPFGKNFPLSGKLIFSVAYDSLNLLLGTSDNKCYIFDGNQVRHFVLQDQQYLSDGNITDAKTIGTSKIAISTSNSGCLVFDKKTGKTIYTVNYDNGLPDDEILAMNSDGEEGVWLAHYYGLTRIDAGIPVKNFSNFKGLSGKPQAIEFFNNKLFVGTSSGIYFLSNKKDFVEFAPGFTRNNAAMSALTPVEPVATAGEYMKTDESKPVEAEKRSFINRLFKRKNHEEKSGTNSQELVQDKGEERSSELISFFGGSSHAKLKPSEVKKTYQISSVRYEYKKVQGLDNKCRQLVVVGKKLVALTISGIYDISENKAIPILTGIDANHMYYVEADDKLYICCDDGLKVLSFENQRWKAEPFISEVEGPVYSFAKDVFDNYWIGGESKVIKVKLKLNKNIKEKKEYKFDNDYRERVYVRISDKKPIFFLPSGIYSIFNDSVQPHRWLSNYAGENSQIYFSHNDYTWIQKKNNWVLLKATEPADTSSQFLNLFTKLSHIYVDKSKNVWVVEDNSSVYQIRQDEINKYKSEFNAFVKRFTGINGEPLALNDVVLSNQDNSIKIRISAPYFLKENSSQYQIFIKGLSKDWGEWSSNPEFSLILPSGNWEIMVRARNVFGNISAERTISFYIKKPFYLSWWFILICSGVLVGAIIQIIKFRERALRHEKEILEAKVKERTRLIEEQKEEIEAQRDDLVHKNIQIEAQKDKIAYQNKEITDSIRYAKRLQTAVLPDDKAMNSLLKDYFVFFRPKDIVSGDFFWVKMKNEKIIIAAADCTGHGVPGGFLSMLGVSFLNEISAIDKEIKAHEMLNILKSRVKTTLIKEGMEDQSKDGMDICLMIFDPKTLKVQYSGANNPLYLIRNSGIIEYTADKMPIGAYIAEKESFSLNEFDAQPGDTFYLFSDGYRDQIGGMAEKRIKSPGFKKLLTEIHKYPMPQQKEKLENFFEEWKGNNDQMDDILVMGIRI